MSGSVGLSQLGTSGEAVRVRTRMASLFSDCVHVWVIAHVANELDARAGARARQSVPMKTATKLPSCTDSNRKFGSTSTSMLLNIAPKVDHAPESLHLHRWQCLQRAARAAGRVLPCGHGDILTPSGASSSDRS